MARKNTFLAVLLFFSALPAWGALVSLPSQTTGQGMDLVVPVTLDPADGVTSLDLVFSYDTAVAVPQAAYLTALTDSFTLAGDFSVPGTIHLALSGGGALAGKAEVVWVVFEVLGAPAAFSNLTWVSASLNGGALPAATADGRIGVVDAAATIFVPDDAAGGPASSLSVPVSTSFAQNVESIDIRLKYNQTVIQATLVQKTALTQPLSLTYNVNLPGEVRIALYGTTAITGSGPLVTISFNVVGTAGEKTPLNLTMGRFNEDRITTNEDDGLFTVCSTADADGDLFTGCQGDCNDQSAAVFPGAPDALCDGTDNDCDGSADEAYQPQATSCGVGACASTGVTSCVLGQVMDSCLPGLPGAETCDGTDEDCDGTVDNPPVPSSAPQLSVSRGTGSEAQLAWNPVAAATAYDLVRGVAGLLLSTAGDFSQATLVCLDNDRTELTFSDIPAPGPGEAFWYLARAVNCGGPGSYDSGGPGQQGSRDPGIALSADPCP